MKGERRRTPSGESVVLDDIGTTRLLEDERVRVWDVSLGPGETHPWHLHHNPYVVLSLRGSEGRMDWLDGSAPRFLSEYRGGAVYRPISPVHRLTNIGAGFYRNRLVELRDLGENRPEPVDIGNGGRSVRTESPGSPTADGRVPVLLHRDVSIWTVDVPPGQVKRLAMRAVPHVLAWIEPAPQEASGGVLVHPGGTLEISNSVAQQRTLFVLELSFYHEPQPHRLARPSESGPVPDLPLKEDTGADEG